MRAREVRVLEMSHARDWELTLSMRPVRRACKMHAMATMYDWYSPNVDIEMMMLKAV